MEQDKKLNDIINCLRDFLGQQTAGVGEYQVIQHLSQQGFFDFLLGSSASLILFKKHFLTMHSLYSLQRRLSGTQQGLIVTPLNIELFDLSVESSQSITMGNLKVRDYYLDLSHLDEATDDSVDALLASFWTRFSRQSLDDDAFSVLGLTAEASWDQTQKAYRRKVQAEHPDKGGNAQKFAEYSEAYQRLKLHFST